MWRQVVRRQVVSQRVVRQPIMGRSSGSRYARGVVRRVSDEASVSGPTLPSSMSRTSSNCATTGRNGVRLALRPTVASAEKGKALLDHGARAFAELLEDVHKFDLARLANRPQILK